MINTTAEPETTQAAGCLLERFQLVVNARVASEPPQLEAIVAAAWNAAATACSSTLEVVHAQCFSPGKPLKPPPLR